MRILLTGHTGFKGSWFALAAHRAGAEVHGYALPPVEGGIFDLAGVASVMHSQVIADVRDSEQVEVAISDVQPDLVVHMAAQALVRRGYDEPRETFDTNVIGTLNVLEAATRTGVRAAVIVTSDKVYRQTGATSEFREDDPLAGDDPYSASKAMADLLARSWGLSLGHRSGLSVATVRAGNVIGGGDRAPDRLVPDIRAAIASGRPVELRHPNATRPWQHVLDAVAGYFAAIRHVLEHPVPFDTWNIGPRPGSPVTVAEIARTFIDDWGRGEVRVGVDDESRPEAVTLGLDPQKAMRELTWGSALDTATAVQWTVEWERRAEIGDATGATRDQLQRYADLSPRDALSLPE